jgi:hypothetical protein
MKNPFDDNGRWLQISKSPEVYSFSRRQRDFFDLRMVAIRLKSGGLLIYSPMSGMSEKEFEQIDRMGSPAWLLAPNHFHNLGIPAFQQQYPKSRICASEQAISRLRKIIKGEISVMESMATELPDGVRFMVPEGLKTGEVWLAITADTDKRVLVECDCFFNMTESKNFLFGWILRMTGGMPGLRVSKVFRMIALKRRSTYLDWIRRNLGEFLPNLLVPSHGEIISDHELSNKLINLV